MGNEREPFEFMVPPHSTEAERSVIGAVLLDNQALDLVSWLPENAFYADQHRRIWAAMRQAIEAGRAVDLVTLCEELGADLERAGGPAYIGELAQNTPSAFNVRRYAELVRDKALLREIARRGAEMAERAIAGITPAAQQLEEAEASIMAVREEKSAGEVVHIGQAVTEYIDWVDEHPNGITMGLRQLDSLTGGLHPGNVIIVAGRPSMGKTTLALQAAEHICADVPGIMFSLEASRREVAGRMIEWHKHKGGRDAAADKIFKLKLFIDETSGITPGAMRARIRRMKRQNGCSLVVVDYLQLMRGKGDSREQEVAYISRELKAIAKDFQVPVLCLAQLNRKVEERADKRPTMGDLRESGAIEQDADLILFPFRPDYYDLKCELETVEAEIIVAKNRNNGRTGLAKVMFSRVVNRFGDWIPEAYRGGAAA